MNVRVYTQIGIYAVGPLLVHVAAVRHFLISIAQEKHLTGCHYGNDMRSTICVHEKFQWDDPTLYSLYTVLIGR